MDLPESLDSINRQLKEKYGIETGLNIPMFRVVFSDTQYEKRMTDTTEEGLVLMYEQVRLMPKYSWIKAKYVLERLVEVPEFQQKELAGVKVSYEPLWVFEDKHSNPLPPTMWACEFCIDALYAALGKKSMGPKYTDPDAEPGAREKRVDRLVEELFGDESNLLGRTITGEAVINQYEKKDE